MNTLKERNDRMNFFVNVSSDGKFYEVTSFKNLKIVYQTQNPISAQAMCEVLNYQPKMSKGILARCLVVLGALHPDFCHKNNLAKVSKSFLEQKLKKIAE